MFQVAILERIEIGCEWNIGSLSWGIRGSQEYKGSSDFIDFLSFFCVGRYGWELRIIGQCKGLNLFLAEVLLGPQNGQVLNAIWCAYFLDTS